MSLAYASAKTFSLTSSLFSLRSYTVTLLFFSTPKVYKRRCLSAKFRNFVDPLFYAHHLLESHLFMYLLLLILLDLLSLSALSGDHTLFFQSTCGWLFFFFFRKITRCPTWFLVLVYVPSFEIKLSNTFFYNVKYRNFMVIYNSKIKGWPFCVLSEIRLIFISSNSLDAREMSFVRDFYCWEFFNDLWTTMSFQAHAEIKTSECLDEKKIHGSVMHNFTLFQILEPFFWISLNFIVC